MPIRIVDLVVVYQSPDVEIEYVSDEQFPILAGRVIAQ